MELYTRTNNTTSVLTNIDVNRVQSLLQASSPIPDNVFTHYEKYVTTTLFAVAPLGVLANILNIIVYCHQGINESITLTFIALSFWDLLNCFLCCLTEICIVLEGFAQVPSVNMAALQYVYVAYTRGLTYVLSTFVTVYLSLERCICIRFPFQVKKVFTTPRVILVNITIVLFGLACYSPAWVTQGLHCVFNPAANRTRLELWLSRNRRQIDLFIDTFNGVVIPTMAQILITICAGLMIQGLEKAAKFRQKEANISKLVNITGTRNAPSKTRDTPTVITQPSMMTNKDLKLTKVVVSLAVIFFACNLPVILVAILRAEIPELDVGKQLFSLYKMLYAFVYHCGLINCTINIVVYYKVSTRYRQEFVTLFCRAKPKNNN